MGVSPIYVYNFKRVVTESDDPQFNRQGDNLLVKPNARELKNLRTSQTSLQISSKTRALTSLQVVDIINNFRKEEGNN